MAELAAPPEGPCLRCGAEGAVHVAHVPHPSIFRDGTGRCAHGPFCGSCAARKEEQTLALCECRALISHWSPPPPPMQRVRPAARAPAAAPELPIETARASAASAAPAPARAVQPRAAAPIVPAPQLELSPSGSATYAPQPRAAQLAELSPPEPSPQPGAEDGYTEDEMAAVLQRALAAVDSLINRVPGSGKAAEGLAAAGAPPKAAPPPPPAPPASGAAAGRSLAEALQLRGGRPRAPKASSGNSFMSRLASYTNWNEACSAVFGALGCSGAVEAAEQVEFTNDAFQVDWDERAGPARERAAALWGGGFCSGRCAAGGRCSGGGSAARGGG